MLVTPMMTISQGNPIARTIAPPVEGPAHLNMNKGSGGRKRAKGALPLWKGSKACNGCATDSVPVAAIGHWVEESIENNTPRVHTNCKAHAEGNICNGIDIAIDRDVAKVHEVTHNRHHGGVHHSCSEQA